MLCEVVDLRAGCGLETTIEDGGDPPASHPPMQVPPTSVAGIWDESLRGKPCGSCGRLDREDEMVVCDRCEGCWHPECGQDGGSNPIHDGPWYCSACRGYIVLHGFSDVSQDLGLIEYLWRGNLPG
jgi:hypothetical protein